MNKRNYDKRILLMIINLRKRSGFPLLAPAIISGLAASSVVFSQAAETTGHVGTSTMASGGPLPTHADAWYENYQFRDGQTLAKLRIHYAILGSPHRNAKGEIDNAILMLHWTGADSRTLLSTAFIKALFNPGRPLDANRYFLIFPDNVGHGQSSKPSDELKAKFPAYGYKDIVDLQHKLVSETLGIQHLHAIIGLSMGGMNAWQWAEAYPDAMDGVMPVVAFPIKVSGTQSAVAAHGDPRDSV